MPKLRVATLNILYDEQQRWERLEMAVAEIKRLKPDVVMLQEVNHDAGVLHKLSKLLPTYHQSFCRRSGNMSGIVHAVLSLKKPLVTDCRPISQNRVLQKTVLEFGGQQISFINVHLYFSPFTDKRRQAQVSQLLDFAEAPAVVAGDFNTLPGSKSISTMKQRFVSAHQAVHSTEPTRTYPSPLWMGRGLRHSLRRGALRTLKLTSKQKLESWGGAIDYIFVEPGIKVTDCQLAFNKPSLVSPELYASDHFGLYADLNIK